LGARLISLAVVPSRPTVVVPWAVFPAPWFELLGEVWDCLRAGGIDRGCPNVMLYRDGVPAVEVGVLLDRPCPLTGRVVTSSLPGGTVATAVHHGPFGEVGATHDAVAGWCSSAGHRTTGVRWEIYGPHDDDPARQWVGVSWLLA
jgi:effector-binding domain-containing protein